MSSVAIPIIKITAVVEPWLYYSDHAFRHSGTVG